MDQSQPKPGRGNAVWIIAGLLLAFWIGHRNGYNVGRSDGTDNVVAWMGKPTRAAWKQYQFECAADANDDYRPGDDGY
jgi:hypothetical protein